MPVSGARPERPARRGQAPARTEGPNNRCGWRRGVVRVQLAKAFGAVVTGVCSTSKAELVREIGADEVIDYTREDFTEGTRQFDLILDTAGRSPCGNCAGLSTPQGTLVIVGGEGGDRWLGGFQAPDLCPRARALHGAEDAWPHLQGAPAGPLDAQGSDRSRQAHARHRQDLSAEGGTSGHTLPRARPRAARSCSPSQNRGALELARIGHGLRGCWHS